MSDDASREHEPTRQARSSSGEAADPSLARRLSELARGMQADPDVGSVLQRVVDAAVVEIESATAAGITVVERGKFSTAAQTDDLVGEIDRVQYAVDEGPCLTSLREAITVRADDLDHEARWPKFASRCTERGVRSMLSFPLFVEHENLGALNVYAAQPGAFRDADETTGLLLASHAAVAMIGKRTQYNLRIALKTRELIGQATGILMERYKVSGDEAFLMLVAVSQHLHRKLRDVADELARTGELPHRPPLERGRDWAGTYRRRLGLEQPASHRTASVPSQPPTTTGRGVVHRPASMRTRPRRLTPPARRGPN
jgi:transcriptional regulator with GAF, ATPase, and Fis domain